MAEIELGGMTFRGGKMMIILTTLSTLGGGLWGGFEIYKDYMDMKEIIANIDTQAISARNDMIELKLGEAIDYTRDIKNDLRADVLNMEDLVDKIQQKTEDKDVTTSIREVESGVRVSEKDVRDTMREVESRIDEKMRLLERDLKEVLQEALDNPLANK
jgi:hypothetical protein